MAVDYRREDRLNFREDRFEDTMEEQSEVVDNEKVAKLIIEEPLKFDSVYNANITTTVKLGNSLCVLFKQAFSDFTGASVGVNLGSGGFDVVLYFEDKSKFSIQNETAGSFSAVELIGGGKIPKNDYERLERMNLTGKNRADNRKYCLSKSAKEILSDFVLPKFKNNKGQVNWNAITFETSDNYGMGYNGNRIYLAVTGLDIVALIRRMYGDKVGGNKVYYFVNPVKPTNTFAPTNNMSTVTTTNYIVNILRLDNDAISEIGNEIGLFPTQGIPMCRI